MSDVPKKIIEDFLESLKNPYGYLIYNSDTVTCKKPKGSRPSISKIDPMSERTMTGHLNMDEGERDNYFKELRKRSDAWPPKGIK